MRYLTKIGLLMKRWFDEHSRPDYLALFVIALHCSLPMVASAVPAFTVISISWAFLTCSVVIGVPLIFFPLVIFFIFIQLFLTLAVFVKTIMGMGSREEVVVHSNKLFKFTGTIVWVYVSLYIFYNLTAYLYGQPFNVLSPSGAVEVLMTLFELH